MARPLEESDDGQRRVRSAAGAKFAARTGADLQEIRRMAGITAAEVARELGYSPSAISRLERRRHVRPRTADRYLAAVDAIADRNPDSSAARGSVQPLTPSTRPPLHSSAAEEEVAKPPSVEDCAKRGPSEEEIRAHVARMVEGTLCEKGWTQGDLARRLPGTLSAARTRVSRLLQDHKPISVAFVSELAIALDLSPAILLEPVFGKQLDEGIRQWLEAEHRRKELERLEAIQRKHAAQIEREAVGHLVTQVVNSAGYMTDEQLNFELERYVAWSERKAREWLAVSDRLDDQFRSDLVEVIRCPECRQVVPRSNNRQIYCSQACGDRARRRRSVAVVA